MTDVLGIEIEQGDLIVELSPVHKWSAIGVATGTQTDSGRIRYITLYESGGTHYRTKRTASSVSIVKISEETFLNSTTFSRGNVQQISLELREEILELVNDIKNK